MPRIAKVIVDLALDRDFDYEVPADLAARLAIGSLVTVPFGARQARGYVIGLADASARADLKAVRAVEGDHPYISDNLLRMARWISDYYAATFEQAVRTLLPCAVRRPGAAFKQALMIRPLPAAADPAAAARLTPRQGEVLAALCRIGPGKLRDFLKATGASEAMARRLATLGVAEIAADRAARDPFAGCEILTTQPLTLMPEQQVAFETVRGAIDTGQPPVVLLFGVTGSGKTEVYLQALDHALRQGKGGIVLVPEIALTPQTVERFRGRFGDRVAVLHSHLSDGERHDEWHRIHAGRAPVVVGARSALFAPVPRLGLIVVDEEHEHSYKQEEAPRYNARDMAVLRGRLEGCAVVLGSATPALESYYNAQRGKYHMVKLTHRVDHRRMPFVRVVDMRIETQRAGKVHVLSQDLVEAIRVRLDQAEQTILFLNRRGFSNSLLCTKCGYVAHCPQCSVTLTYHKVGPLLCCHICGWREAVPETCPNPTCRDPAFRYPGAGTQKVEELVAQILPRARLRRMDSDSMTRKDAYHEVLGDFRAGKIDILIGTQMLAKGLHFPNVTLVGIIHADLGLHLPDFRAGERTFQLITQVAGRAGRGDVSGEVIVQTYTPFHPAIQAARRLDYEGFADQELAFRKETRYPPFQHVACVTIRGPDQAATAAAATEYAETLRRVLGPSVAMAGPLAAPLARAKGMYRFQLLLRAPAAGAMSGPLKQTMKSFKWPRGMAGAVDMDALSLL